MRVKRWAIDETIFAGFKGWLTYGVELDLGARRSPTNVTIGRQKNLAAQCREHSDEPRLALDLSFQLRIASLS